MWTTASATRALRRTLKFLHTLGAAGFVGGLAALAVVMVVAPASSAVSGGAAGLTPLIGVAAKMAAWIIGPSMLLTVISGLLAMAANPAYYEAGWVWVNAATGILILEGSLHIMGPIQEEAKRAAGALAGAPDAAGLATLVAAEGNTVWVILAVAAANIALGVWRPRFFKGWF